MDERDRELVAKYFRDKLTSSTERIGCPERSVLEEIAAGKLPPSSPWYDHLTACGGCFREAEQIRVELRTTRVRSRSWGVAAVAAALVLGVGMLWWSSRPGARPSNPTRAGQPPPPAPKEPAPKERVEAPPPTPPPSSPAPKRPRTDPEGAVLAVLDLSAFSLARGKQAEEPKTNPSIRAAQQRLHIILPVASEPGRYHVKLLDKDLRTLRETYGAATVKGGRSILNVALNAGVAPGLYQLALQWENEDWRLYPLEVKP